MVRPFAVVAGVLALVALAQQQPPPAEPPKPEEPKPEAPAKPVYSFQGKPLKLEFSCKDDDIAAFGLTCTPEEPCEAYLELAAVEALGNRVFLTGNIHTSAVTLWSVLLTSEDAGKSWMEMGERMRSTGLEQIQFLDFEHGWIGGQQLLALPRDPFLLITSDGGKTWRKRPVSSESRVGAIEEFAFENRNNGALLIDRTQTGDSGGRHELYESSTGGDSWSLRQVSPRPLKLRRPRAPNTDWRVRADAKTQSYLIERRVAGDKWQILGAFLIQTGECKPVEVKLAEPPPEPDEAKPEPPPPLLKKKQPAQKKKPH